MAEKVRVKDLVLEVLEKKKEISMEELVEEVKKLAEEKGVKATCRGVKLVVRRLEKEGKLVVEGDKVKLV